MSSVSCSYHSFCINLFMNSVNNKLANDLLEAFIKNSSFLALISQAFCYAFTLRPTSLYGLAPVISKYTNKNL